MTTHNFENLEVWKRGCGLAVKLCVATHGSREFALKDQMTRAAISIPSNIAEGAERFSDADFSRFVNYSKGSCGELRTQLMVHEAVCKKIGTAPFKGTEEMIDEIRELSRILGALINRLSPNS